MRQQLHCILVSFWLSLYIKGFRTYVLLFFNSYLLPMNCVTIDWYTTLYIYFFILNKVWIVLFQNILIFTATGKNSCAQLSHISIILTNSLPLVFILVLCVRIHVYTIHSLAAIGWIQYFLKQYFLNVDIPLLWETQERSRSQILQPSLDELILCK